MQVEMWCAGREREGGREGEREKERKQCDVPWEGGNGRMWGVTQRCCTAWPLAQSLTDSGAIEIQKHNPGTHGSWVWSVLTHKRSRYKWGCQRSNLPCGLGGKIDTRHKPKAPKRGKAYSNPPHTTRGFASWSFSYPWSAAVRKRPPSDIPSEGQECPT